MRSRSVALAVSAALVVAACSGSDDAAEAPSTDPAPTDSVEEDVDTADEPVDEPAADEPAEEEESTTTVDAASSDGIAVVDVEGSVHAPLAALVTVRTDDETLVDVTATSGDHVVDVPLPAATSTEHQIPVIGMRADQTYALSVDVLDADGASIGVVDGLEFTTDPLPEYFGDHQLTIDAERAAPGFTVIEFDTLSPREGATSSQHLVAYDNDGEVVWYYENTGALGGFEVTPAGTFNIFYWPFGTREVDFLGNVVGNWRPLASGADPSVITNEELFEGIDPEQVDFQGGLGALVGNPGDAEPVPVSAEWVDLATIHHEAWPMPNGNTLTLSTTTHELTPEQREAFCPGDPAPFNAISDVAVEFTPDGTVVRTWDLWDVIDIDEFPGGEMCVPAGIFAEENARDWTHANSAIYDPERDAVIISSRHTNQIVAFDHLDDEGPQTQLRWILGAGSTMPLDGEPTTYQHAVEVNADGSLIVYDNGNDRPTNQLATPGTPSSCTSVVSCANAYSRAVIYDVDDSSDDPADWTATQRWEHIDTEDNGNLAYSGFISDADQLSNGNVLITHGGIGTFPPGPEDPLHILIREVVPEGESGGDIVWELQSELGFVTYRSERIETFYNGPEWAN
jgi:arylsulfate sulfotransferase